VPMPRLVRPVFVDCLFPNRFHSKRPAAAIWNCRLSGHALEGLTTHTPVADGAGMTLAFVNRNGGFSMQPHGRHFVVDENFDSVLIHLLNALQDEGVEIAARIDVREHFKRTVGRKCRPHLIFDVWSPDLVLNAVPDDLEVGAFVLTRFVVYELVAGQTAVIVIEGLSPLISDSTCRGEHPAVAALADRERERVTRVLARLQRAGPMASAA
jgi:uncharacterized protein (DUF302 family)